MNKFLDELNKVMTEVTALVGPLKCNIGDFKEKVRLLKQAIGNTS